MRNWIVAIGLKRGWMAAAARSDRRGRLRSIVAGIDDGRRIAANGIANSGAASGAIAQRSLQHGFCGAGMQQSEMGSSNIRTAAPIAVILTFMTGNVSPSEPQPCDRRYAAT